MHLLLVASSSDALVTASFLADFGRNHFPEKRHPSQVEKVTWTQVSAGNLLGGAMLKWEAGGLHVPKHWKSLWWQH